LGNQALFGLYWAENLQREIGMNVDGVWKIEILGPYGWEAVSTAFLEKGRYLAASQDHYTIGKYEVSGDNIKVEGSVHAHSESQHFAGSGIAPRNFGCEGQISGARISGQIEDSAAQQTMTARGTRLGDLP
jgi:hypothetical protein